MVFTAQQDTNRNNSKVYRSDTPIQSKFCTNSPHRTITVRIFFMFEKKMSSLFLDTRFHSNRKYGFLIFVGAMALLAFRYWKFWVFKYPRTYPAFTQKQAQRVDEAAASIAIRSHLSGQNTLFRFSKNSGLNKISDTRFPADSANNKNAPYCKRINPYPTMDAGSKLAIAIEISRTSRSIKQLPIQQNSMIVTVENQSEMTYKKQAQNAEMVTPNCKQARRPITNRTNLPDDSGKHRTSFIRRLVKS